MGRYFDHGRRKDSLQDHRHALPNGVMTGGMLDKPSAGSQGPIHTHLYEHEECFYETDPAHDEPGHTHGADELGSDTSGPVPMDKLPGEAWRKDSSAELEQREHQAALKRSAG